MCTQMHCCHKSTNYGFLHGKHAFPCTDDKAMHRALWPKTSEKKKRNVGKKETEIQYVPVIHEEIRKWAQIASRQTAGPWRHSTSKDVERRKKGLNDDEPKKRKRRRSQALAVRAHSWQASEEGRRHTEEAYTKPGGAVSLDRPPAA